MILTNLLFVENRSMQHAGAGVIHHYKMMNHTYMIPEESGLKEVVLFVYGPLFGCLVRLMGPGAFKGRDRKQERTSAKKHDSDGSDRNVRELDSHGTVLEEE